MNRLLSAPGRAFGLFLLAVAALCVAVTVASFVAGDSPALIISDGKQYYAWARSVLLDRDLDFGNDYRALYPPDPLPPEDSLRTLRWLPANRYTPGLAILEAPGMLIGHALAALLPGVPADGVSSPYQFAVVWSLIAFCLWSCLLLYRALVGLGAGRSRAAVLVAAMLAATNLIHYLAKEPAMAHAAGVGLFNTAFWLAARLPAPGAPGSLGRRLALGAVVALLVMVRNSNVVLLPVLAMAAWSDRRPSLRGAGPVLLAGSVVFALQPLSLFLLWGEWRLVSYAAVLFTAGAEGITDALWSARHGLFVHHPWYLVLLVLAAAGAFAGERMRRVAWAALFSFAALAVINGTWWAWWFGDSFGNRGFIEVLPALTAAVALAPLPGWSPRRRTGALLAAALLAGALNGYLWAGYLLQRYPHGGSGSLARTWAWPASPGEARRLPGS